MPNNLPLNLPALIGREAELATVVELLAGTHLITLVGAGGVGKTRFALEVADTVRGDYKDGVWFVELAPVADPALVPRTVASALDVHEEPGRPLLDTLLDFLRRRELLIVLDNCEHLVEACARWAEKVLHTSAGNAHPRDQPRSAWASTARRRGACPRCARPSRVPTPSDEQLMGYAATRLFVQRAIAASPAFRLTQDNAAAVAQHLPSARRHSAGARAGGGAREGDAGGAGGRSAARPLRAADARQPHRAAAPPDAALADRLEP